MNSPLLQAQKIERRFGSVQALRGIDLELFPGQVYGLVGPDGAGKTTTIRILVGLMAPSLGQAFILGMNPMKSGHKVRECVGYMPQQYSLYGDLTVDENLSFFSKLFSLPKKTFEERRAMLLSITRLERFGNRRADALSGGMYKKLALACALLHRPKLLVLDEPTNGVDPVSRREFWDLLRDFVSEGMGVLISTPYMDEAARCHRVGLLHQGKMLEEGAPEELLKAFPHSAYIITGADRHAIADYLEAEAATLALSPAGSGLRVVLDKAAETEVFGKLRVLGAQWEKSATMFEDVFLARMHEAHL